MTKVIDCRKCANCDIKNDRCKIYGSDPKAAVEACAAKHFGAYRPNWRPKTYSEVQSEVQHGEMD